MVSYSLLPLSLAFVFKSIYALQRLYTIWYKNKTSKTKQEVLNKYLRNTQNLLTGAVLDIQYDNKDYVTPGQVRDTVSQREI